MIYAYFTRQAQVFPVASLHSHASVIRLFSALHGDYLPLCLSMRIWVLFFIILKFYFFTWKICTGMCKRTCTHAHTHTHTDLSSAGSLQRLPVTRTWWGWHQEPRTHSVSPSWVTGTPGLALPVASWVCISRKLDLTGSGNGTQTQALPYEIQAFQVLSYPLYQVPASVLSPFRLP